MTRDVRKRHYRESVLGFIQSFYEDNGFSPTFREIAVGTGLRSTASVSAYVHALIEDGFLSGSAARPRKLTVTEYGRMMNDATSA
ncbi:MAG: hypothetical protein IJ074_06390 [Clostridia bacterium]|nr:hypothetical protein [Clostridia bacterium]MBQ8972692.1 hypothetical protein [Clostridia bacterium]